MPARRTGWRYNWVLVLRPSTYVRHGLRRLGRLGYLRVLPFPFGQTTRWLILSAAVGVVAGLGAILFHTLSQGAMALFLGRLAGLYPEHPAGEPSLFAPAAGALRPFALIWVPALGGLLSGLIVHFLAREAAGHGTDAAIDAYHRNRGVIRARVPLVKIVSSALTIGSGGSGGREGPIAQVGAGFGSLLGSWLHLPERDRRVLLAAGMGAGVGSIFRSPLAGALFASEILYSEMEFESEVLLPATLSSIVAYCTFSLHFGFGSLFRCPPLSFHTPWELVPYTLLGLICAGAAWLYVGFFYRVHDRFEALRLPGWAKPALGAGLAGLVGLSLYALHGDRGVLDVLSLGYGTLQKGLEGKAGVSVLLLVAAGKIVTTALTIGSGGSGGVFGPSVVIGGSLGGAFGLWFHALYPEMLPEPAACVPVGMAGFFAAAAKTPVSTLLMVSEMTGNYLLLLPSMWVCALATLLARPVRLYRMQAPRRADSPAHKGEFMVDVLQGISSGKVCLPASEVECVPESEPLDALLRRMSASRQNIFPVLDAEGKLTGLVRMDDLRQMVMEREGGSLIIAGDLARPARPSVLPDDDLRVALQRLVESDLAEIPVLDPADPARLKGMLSRRDIIRAYQERRAELRGPG